jgi:predicted nucleotide-binding protein
MRKSTIFYGSHFDEKAIRETLRAFEKSSSKKTEYQSLTVVRKKETWTYDTLDEFYAALPNSLPQVIARDYDCKTFLAMTEKRYGVTQFDVAAPTSEKIETVFSALESHIERCRIPDWQENEERPIRIFIGHGHSHDWKDLKDHLHDKHNYEIEAYEIGARAGHGIRDILQYMLEGSSIAFLVMTGEDQMMDGTTNPRLNVVHETGLFQGKLGFERAIVLLEEGTKEFSNMHGIQHIPFAKGNIAAIFGEVLAVLRREFGPTSKSSSR